MRHITKEVKNDRVELIQKEIDDWMRKEQEFRTLHHIKREESPPKEQNEEYMSSNSDDSGISTSSVSVTPTLNNAVRERAKDVVVPQPQPRSSIKFSSLSSAMSNNNTSHRQFVKNQRGIMQRFIASRGKMAVKRTTFTETPNTSVSTFLVGSFEQDPIRIERDQLGRPIRRGYVPVEEKILKELQDLKLREVELRRSRQDLFQDTLICQYNLDTEEPDTYDPPIGKLKLSKSIGELYEASLNADKDNVDSYECINKNEKKKPSVSLAQLCDSNPEEVPSSHMLIEKWENLIQAKKHQKGL